MKHCKVISYRNSCCFDHLSYWNCLVSLQYSNKRQQTIKHYKHARNNVNFEMQIDSDFHSLAFWEHGKYFRIAFCICIIVRHFNDFFIRYLQSSLTIAVQKIDCYINPQYVHNVSCSVNATANTFSSSLVFLPNGTMHSVLVISILYHIRECKLSYNLLSILVESFCISYRSQSANRCLWHEQHYHKYLRIF